jgi:hypothetical protein
MAKIIRSGHKIYEHFPLQGPPKYTQIGIFGHKINHLATLFKTINFYPSYFARRKKSCFFLSALA